MEQYGYRLNKDVDWDNPNVQQVWQVYGQQIGRFLSTDRTLTATELTDYLWAYNMQHGTRKEIRRSAYVYVTYVLLELSDVNIVLISRLPRLAEAPHENNRRSI